MSEIYDQLKQAEADIKADQAKQQAGYSPATDTFVDGKSVMTGKFMQEKVFNDTAFAELKKSLLEMKPTLWPNSTYESLNLWPSGINMDAACEKEAAENKVAVKPKKPASKTPSRVLLAGEEAVLKLALTGPEALQTLHSLFPELQLPYQVKEAQSESVAPVFQMPPVGSWVRVQEGKISPITGTVLPMGPQENNYGMDKIGRVLAQCYPIAAASATPILWVLTTQGNIAAIGTEKITKLIVLSPSMGPGTDGA